MIYNYPKKTYFGKMIAKSKIYTYSNVSTVTKEKFSVQIDKIIWSHKLAPETINLTSSDLVPEIQIIDVRLKTKTLSEELLRVIDKSIPYPIFFQLHFDNKIKIKAAYKSPSDTDSNKWIVDSYFESEWFDNTSEKVDLPVVLDLNKLYEKMFHSLIPKEVNFFKNQVPIKEKIDKIHLFKEKEKEYIKLKAKRDKEKQFNRKAELNTRLKKLNKELESIKG